MKTHRMALLVAARQMTLETRQMLALAAGLTRLGHEVDLIVPQAHEELIEGLAHGVRLVELGVHSELTCVLALTRYLARHRPCVLLSSGLAANLKALKVSRLDRWRVPVIAHHAVTPATELVAAGSKARGMRRRMALKYPHAALVLVESDEAGCQVRHEGGIEAVRVVTLPLGPDEDTGALSEHQLVQCLSLMLSAAEVEDASPFSPQSWQVGSAGPAASLAQPSPSLETSSMVSRQATSADTGASAPLMSSANLQAKLVNSGARE
ncbi:glycosyltransferase family 4 protein [Cobetia sp. Ld8]|uniref:glycosyltransferase family 4 protein n=1 Tax=Cobetia sp. Ld8 TaxID=649154 RepID=UPI0038688A7F